MKDPTLLQSFVDGVDVDLVGVLHTVGVFAAAPEGRRVRSS